MTITKFITLVESSDEDSADAVARAVRAWSDEPVQGVHGLIVGQLLEPVTAVPPVVLTIQSWVEGADADAVVQRLTDGRGTASTWRVSEHVYRRPEPRLTEGVDPQRINMFGTAIRRPDFDHDAFFRYWDTVHAPITGHVPGLVGYVSYEVLERVAGAIPADGLMELWWPDRATFESSADTPQQAAAWEDVGNYAETTGAFWLTREHVLVAPPETGPGSEDDPDA